MAISLSPFLLITFFFLLTPITIHSDPDPVVTDLVNLRSKNPRGLIRLNDSLLQRILSMPSPKPFSSFIFFDAKQLHSKPDIALPSFKFEFSLVSYSYLTNNPENNTQIFFFVMEFQESQSSFVLFGIKTLPHVRYVPNFVSDVKNDTIEMDASGYARGAESMAEFVELNANNVNVGPIHRPPVIPKKLMMIMGAGFLIWSPYLVKKFVIGNPLLENKYTWMISSIFVYFFSVAGTMHSIIRKVPMFLVDKDDPSSKMMFFYQRSGMQLGFEGFVIGLLYTIVGLFLAFASHGLVCLKDRGKQRILMVLGLIVSFWAVKEVIYLDSWKTGYHVHPYWPKRWMS